MDIGGECCIFIFNLQSGERNRNRIAWRLYMVAGSVVDVEELRRTIFCSLLKQLLLPTYHLIPSSLFFFFFSF